MFGPFVHRIDPILLDVAGVHLWWYGLGFALGFLQVFLFVRRARHRLGLTESDVYAFSVLFAVCVLAGGRAIEVAFDEWPFYSREPWLIPALWLGGMATHGLLVGAAAAIAIFSHVSGRSLLALADELAIPGACLLAIGRVGNFIDGQIVGSVTDGWWGVKFPDAEGFRHPVVLYDSAKNLLLVPLLLWVRRTQPPPGRVAAHFVFWYAFLRVFVDLFRDYPTHRLALGTGQTLNVAMAATGAALLIRSWIKRRPPLAPAPVACERSPRTWHRLAFAGLLLLCLTIPSNWTQDVPARYGKRHAGLEHTRLYPIIDSSPPTRLSSLPTR